MASQKPLCFILSGAPNAGKTTQCKILCGNTGLIHLSTGDIFRKAMREKTELGMQVKTYIDRGDMVPDSLVIAHIVSRIGDDDVQKYGCILDGYPRTPSQAQALIAKIRVDAFILIQVPTKALLDRAKNRRVDPVTDNIYNMKYVPPPKDIVSRLVKREFDENLGVRLMAYQSQFRRIEPYFSQNFYTINGLRSLDKVSASLAGVIRTAIAAHKAQPLPASSASSMSSTCVICLDATADHLVIPCGHKCGCSTCLSHLTKCPICRVPITKIQRVFEAGATDHDEAPATAAPALPAAVAAPTRADDVTQVVAAMADLTDSDDDWGDDSEEEETAASDGPKLTITPSVDIEESSVSAVPVAVHVDVPDKSTREPVDICCVVDVSGSMVSKATYEAEQANGEVVKKNDGFSILDIVKHAIKAVMHMLEPNDRVAVVAFNSKARVVFKLSPMTPSTRRRCISILAPLPPAGQTNIWAGLLAGMDLLRKSEMHRPKYLLLLTDGVPNISPPRGHVAELQSYRELHPELFRSFQLHCFGFGYQLDSQMLLELATEGNGHYSFIPDALIVGTVFVNAVANLLCNSYANCKLHLTLKGGSKFAGDVIGNYTVSEETWGKVVRVGVLQCGQRRSFVVPLELPAGVSASTAPYLEANLTYHHSALDSKHDSSLYRASAQGTARKSTLDATAALLRSKLVSCGYAAVAKPGKNAQRQLTELSREMRSCSGTAGADDATARGQISAMGKDTGGRMLKALKGVKRFNRWGKHYLRAISRAHQISVCTNFMDAGLQEYGGKFFQSLRDKGDKVFVGLKMAPPRYQPKKVQATAKATARQRYAAARQRNAHVAAAPAPAPAPAPTTYYAGSGGGCFGAGCEVLVQDTTTGHFKATKITSVQPGDVLAAAGNLTARVRCVARIERDPKSDALLRLPTGLQITPKHPVRVAGQWCRPRDLPGAQPMDTEHITPSNNENKGKFHVYNFLLDSSHVIKVNDMECVTWGHGLNDPGAAHPYFGDMAAVERDLRGMSGWANGVVHIAGCHRDSVTHKVVGLCSAV